MWSNLADDTCVRDIPVAISRYIVILDGAKGVGPLNTLLLQILVVSANALAEPSKFICVRCIPELFVGWVLSELAVFEHPCVQYWERQWGSGHEAGVVGGFHEERKAIVVCL